MSISIANRILLGFAAITALIIGLGIYALSQIGDVRDATETIVERDLSVLRQLDTVRVNEQRMRDTREGIVTRYLLRSLGRDVPNVDDSPAIWRQQAAAAEASITAAVAAANRYAAQALSRERAEAWRQVGQTLGESGTALRQIQSQSERQIEAVATNDIGAVQARQAELAASASTFKQTLDSANTLLNNAIATGQQRVGAIYEESRLSITAARMASVLLSFLVTYAIRRSIVGPLSSFMEFVERVGRGDLAGQTASVGADEIGRLGGTLNRMVDGLRDLALQSRGATENLNAAAAEIRASMQEQAASVEEQLAAVQETAATVDEITHAGAQIGKRAQEVIATAQATATTSSAGLRAVDETVRAMDAIREQAEAVAENIVALSEKTQAIGEIISTVNDISERSHLLALNAAIEAAAAGESGRSFAVVASEMKVLADQAKDATAQVRSILGDIQRGINSSVMLTEEAVKRVTAGKERTDTTYQTIDEITSRVQEGVQTFQQIVASTNQQQLGIEQVMAALQSIRQASQQTAAGTRQLDAAAANLTGLSQQLLGLAERYRV